MAGERVTVPYHLQVHGNHLTGYALKELQRDIDQFGSSTTVAVAEDPNLDPFYLERALETSQQWDTKTIDDSDVELEDLENEYFMSYMTEEKQPSPPSHLYHPTQIVAAHYDSHSLRTPVCPTTPDWQRTHNHYSQSSCSSFQTDATGVTPDLTPSSSFSSTCSASNCPDEVRKATQQLAFHSENLGRNRSHSTAPFYLPAGTPDTQSRACTRPSTPAERITTATPGSENLSSETLIMVPKEPRAHAASSLRSKPLPNLPPILKNSGPAPRKKSHSAGSKSQIDTSLISPPSLMNPVTMEPHTSPFDHALFIPAQDCPSPVPNPANPSPPITRQVTNASMKDRPSTSTSVARGEQSVWESDSDSESVGGRSQSRRGPIDTLRKVRSRVQLRRIAKSDAKLHAEITNPLDAPPPPPPELPHLPLYLDERAAVSVTSVTDVLPPPLKQTLRLVAPSTTSLPRPPSQSTEKGAAEIDTSTAAAIQAQTRRRQRSNATDEFLPFSKAETFHQYYCHQPSSNTETSSLYRTNVFKKVWESLRSLNCRSMQ